MGPAQGLRARLLSLGVLRPIQKPILTLVPPSDLRKPRTQPPCIPPSPQHPLSRHATACAARRLLEACSGHGCAVAAYLLATGSTAGTRLDRMNQGSPASSPR